MGSRGNRIDKIDIIDSLTWEIEEAESVTSFGFPHNDVKYTAHFMQAYTGTRTKGVFSADNNLALIPAGGMSVTLTPGTAWIPTRDGRGLVYRNDKYRTFSFPPAHGSLTQVYSMVVRNDLVKDATFPEPVIGEPAVNPLPPAPIWDANTQELILQDIFIPPGTTEITPSMIRDQRLNEELCGIMRDGVTGIPTQMLHNMFMDRFRDVEDFLSGDVLGNIWARIEETNRIVLETTIAQMLQPTVHFSQYVGTGATGTAAARTHTVPGRPYMIAISSNGDANRENYIFMRGSSSGIRASRQWNSATTNPSNVVTVVPENVVAWGENSVTITPWLTTFITLHGTNVNGAVYQVAVHYLPNPVEPRTVRIVDENGSPIENVLVRGLISPSMSDLMTDRHGEATGFIIGDTITLDGFIDRIRAEIPVASVLAGITNEFVYPPVANGTIVTITTSGSYRFTDNVDTYDEFLAGAGASGGTGQGSRQWTGFTYLQIVGAGGGGGELRNTFGLIPDTDTPLHIIVGAGGIPLGTGTNRGTRGGTTTSGNRSAVGGHPGSSGFPSDVVGGEPGAPGGGRGGDVTPPEPATIFPFDDSTITDIGGGGVRGRNLSTTETPPAHAVAPLGRGGAGQNSTAGNGVTPNSTPNGTDRGQQGGNGVVMIRVWLKGA